MLQMRVATLVQGPNRASSQGAGLKAEIFSNNLPKDFDFGQGTELCSSQDECEYESEAV